MPRHWFRFINEELTLCTRTDTHPVFAVAYNHVNTTIITTSSVGVKIWNAHTGELQREFDDLGEASGGYL